MDNRNNQNTQQLSNWIQSASPEEIVTGAKQVLAKIGDLPQDQRDRFARDIQSDPAVAKLFTQHA